MNSVAVDRSDALLLAYVLIFGTWLFAGAGVAQEFCVCCGEQREDEVRPRLMAAVVVVVGGDVVYKLASFVEEEHQSAVQQPRPQEPGTSPPKRPCCC